MTIGARLYDGPTTLINRAHTRTDALNLTNIFDVVSKTRFQHDVTPANNASLWYSPANRLQNADGPWGSETFTYDGVGNRIEHRTTPPGGSETIATLGYPATSNRVTQITQNASFALRRRLTSRAKGARDDRGAGPLHRI